MEYVAFPTTTHFVERSVKVYNFCSNKSRSEERVSQFAICYNIVHDVNDVAKKSMIKQKTEKGQCYKDNSNIKAVGKIKNQTVLQNAFDRHNEIEDALKTYPHLRDVFNDIKDTITYNDATSFKEERQNIYFEEVSAAMEKARKPNKVERQQGVAYTPAIQNHVRFHDAKTGHEKGILAELDARGFTFDSSVPKIKGLRNKLKEIMIQQGETEEVHVSNIKFFPIMSNYDWSKLTQK